MSDTTILKKEKTMPDDGSRLPDLTVERCIHVLRKARRENYDELVKMQHEYYQTNISTDDFLEKYEHSELARVIVALQPKK
jgi:hypothetical protein